MYSAKEAVPPLGDRTFPMIIGHKSASVKIYATPNRGVESYTVVHHSDGIRERITQRDFNAAFKLAQSIAIKTGDGTGDVLLLNGRDRLIYERAVEVASKMGVDLDVLASRFNEAASLIGGPEHLVPKSKEPLRQLA